MKRDRVVEGSSFDDVLPHYKPNECDTLFCHDNVHAWTLRPPRRSKLLKMYVDRCCESVRKGTTIDAGRARSPEARQQLVEQQHECTGKEARENKCRNSCTFGVIHAAGDIGIADGTSHVPMGAKGDLLVGAFPGQKCLFGAGSR